MSSDPDMTMTFHIAWDCHKALGDLTFEALNL